MARITLNTEEANELLGLKGSSVGLGKFRGQCAALVQYFDFHRTSEWSRGERVQSLSSLAQYTAIASFRKGVTVYENNHAAFFIGKNATGIQVIDQWDGKLIGERTLRYKSGYNPLSNCGIHFYTIEVDRRIRRSSTAGWK